MVILCLSRWIESTVVAVRVTRKATAGDGAKTVRDRLHAALPEAMKARDVVAVTALRSALGALDNAESVDIARAPQPHAGHSRLAGTVSGLRATEVERRSLTVAEMDQIVRAEVADRHAAAADYERRGRPDHAARLRDEAAVLGDLVGKPEHRLT